MSNRLALINRRKWLQLTGASAATLLLANCAPQRVGRAATNELLVGQLHEPTNLDVIQRAADVGSTEVLQQLYGSLLHYSYKTGKLEGELAESWNAKSPVVWELKLREGVMFHKGYGEFTADDVAFNVNYTIEKKALRVNRFRFVKGARATGKYTVEYELEKPFAPFFMSTLRGIAGQMVSKKAYEEMGEKPFARNPIGTGPWQLESWKPGEVVLTRNKDYWRKDRPYLDKLTFIPVPDAFVRRQKIEAGEIDFMGQPDYKDLAGMRSNTNLIVDSVPGTNWDFIQFNTRNKSVPWAKDEVRQAVAYAINREALIKSVYQGEATATDSPLPPGYLGHTKGPIEYPYEGDIARAKALMATAGVSEGFSVTCSTSDKPNLVRATEIVADQLRQLNINVQIRTHDVPTYTSKWLAGDFEMQLEDISIVSTDPDDVFTNFQHSKGAGNMGWSLPEVDSLVDEARTIIGDDERRAAIYKRLVELTVEGAAYIYLAHTNVARIMRKGLVGWESTPYEQEIFLESLRWA